MHGTASALNSHCLEKGKGPGAAPAGAAWSWDGWQGLAWVWQGLTWVWQGSFPLGAVPSQQIRCRVTSEHGQGLHCVLWLVQRNSSLCLARRQCWGLDQPSYSWKTCAKGKRKSLFPRSPSFCVSRSWARSAECHIEFPPSSGSGHLAWTLGWRPKLSAGFRRLKGKRFKPLASFK